MNGGESFVASKVNVTASTRHVACKSTAIHWGSPCAARHPDPLTPVTLVETGDGERLLVDPATHRTIRLAAFGPENQRSFDAIFDGGRA